MKTPAIRGNPNWAKGISGNPAGRALGSRNSVTLALEALLDGEGEQLTRKTIEMALAGDAMALKLCVERLIPIRRGRPVRFALPKLDSANDAVQLIHALVVAVARGEVTPTEAADIGPLVDAFLRAVAAAEFDRRLLALEERGQDAVRS